MKVFKFGGVSVKDAEAVKNLAEILKLHAGNDIVVVISAMGKTTNALERLTKAHIYKEGDPVVILSEIKDFHIAILRDLFLDSNSSIYDEINDLFVELEWVIEEEPLEDYDYEYDQVVSVGEMISTKIVSAYLIEARMGNDWVDARDFLKTDSTWREAKVDWELSGVRCRELINKYFGLPAQKKEKGGIIVTQGFIGVTSENHTTTLGREGSDYTAAIIACLMDADEVIIWKDVPGVLNADPKWFGDTVILDKLSYHEAIELSFFGATVIHPKTIKPLQNKYIPLKVKSFFSPGDEGTYITHVKDIPAGKLEETNLIPSYIVKTGQVLISISPKDFSFIVEENISRIFGYFAEYGTKVNMMQHSAISFSVCVDDDKIKIPGLIETLQLDFKVLYNKGLELITIRHYNLQIIDKVTKDKEILVEQKSRQTARFVVKPGN